MLNLPYGEKLQHQENLVNLANAHWFAKFLPSKYFAITNFHASLAC